MPAGRLRPARRASLPAALVLVAVTTTVACEPVDEPLPDVVDDAARDRDESGAEAVGSPAEEVPGDLAGLTERTAPEAERWQPDPRPAEAAVRLHDGRWRSASVTYVAAEADSALVVRVDDDGLATERISFHTLGLDPLPHEALEGFPAMTDLVAPADLAAAAEERFDECDAAEPAVEVRLATGAPATWEGDGWAQEPRWRAAVTNEEGRGVRLDAVTAEPDGEQRCVDAVVPTEPGGDPPSGQVGGPGGE